MMYKYIDFIQEGKIYKIWNKVYNWLDRDNLGNIVLDHKVFWFEKTCSLATFPNYIYDYLIKWGTKRGFTHLSNIPTK